MQTAAREEAPLWHDARGTGPPLLLVHGTGGGAASWRGVVEHVQKQHLVITYDRRGFARSAGTPHPARGYYRHHADDAARLLDTLGIARASVCGFSAGGLVALELALSHPDRVSSLVLYEPPFHAARGLPLGPMAGYAWSMLLRLAGRKRAAAEALFRVVLGRDWTRMPQAGRDKLLEDADAVLHEVDCVTGADFTARRLALLVCPVTIMVGGASAPFLIAAGDRLSRLMPRAGMIRVPQAGHAMPVLQPLAFADVIARAFTDMSAILSRRARE